MNELLYKNVKIIEDNATGVIVDIFNENNTTYYQVELDETNEIKMCKLEEIELT